MPTSLPTVTNLWTAYGLRGDPFFREPLEPTTGLDEPRPATLLVGRGPELEHIQTLIESSSSSRTIIQGEAGVGKTSFVSALKARLQSERILTHREPVRVQPDMTARTFVAEVLKVILQMYMSERVQAGAMRNLRNRVAAGLRDTEGEFWTRLQRIVLGEDNTGFGVTAGAVGLQGQRGRIAAEAGDVSLFEELKTALRYMAKNGSRCLVLHVNNMENLNPQDARAAATLIHSLRDVFQFDHAHWLFVGTSDIEQRLFRVHPQVSQIIDRPVTLGPLRSDEVGQLLARRYQHLQLGIHRVDPVGVQEATRLYARFDGELRAFLGLLGDAARRWAPSHPGMPMTVHDVLQTLAPTVHAELVVKLGENDTTRLQEIIREYPFDAEFRVSDVERRCTMTQAGASKLIGRLVEHGVIVLTRSRGKSKFYALSASAVAITGMAPQQ